MSNDFTELSLLRPRSIIAFINFLLIVISVISLLSVAYYFSKDDWKNDKAHWRAIIDSALVQYSAFHKDYEDEIESNPNLSDKEKTKAIISFYYLPCEVLKGFQSEISTSHFSLHSTRPKAELLAEINAALVTCADFQKKLPKMVSIKRTGVSVLSAKYQLDKAYLQVSEANQSVVKAIKNQIRSRRILSGTWIDHSYMAFLFMILIFIKMMLIPFIGFNQKHEQRLDASDKEFESLVTEHFFAIEEKELMSLMSQKKKLSRLYNEEYQDIDKRKAILWILVTGILGMIFVGETLHSSYAGYFSKLLIIGFILMSAVIRKKS